MGKPHPALLNREEARSMMAEHYEPQLGALADMVNYGTMLLIRCLSENKEWDIVGQVAVANLSKHAVAMLDGIHVQLVEGSVIPAQVALRTMFECSMYVLWICQADSDERARAYYVAELRERRLWARRIIPGTEENRNFGGPMEFIEGYRDTPESRAELEMVQREALKVASAIDGLLQRTEYNALNQKFDIRKAKKGREPHWHEVVRANTIADVAQQLGIRHEYDVIYHGLAKVTHSREMRQQTHYDGEVCRLLPVRNLQEAGQTINLAMTTALRLYRRLLEVYRGPELDQLRRKYLESWQKPFWDRKNIRYTFE